MWHRRKTDQKESFEVSRHVEDVRTFLGLHRSQITITIRMVTKKDRESRDTQKHEPKPTGHLLEVHGIKSGEIAYNPAVIVQKNIKKIVHGVNIIAARVESLNSHWLDPKLYDPHVVFFIQQDDVLVPIPNTPVFHKFEDPWATWLSDSNDKPQLLFGGVKIDFNGKTPVVKTQFYLASSVQELDVDHPIAEIRSMKDVRVAQLQTGKIAVFTRPTTDEAFPGRIGFTIINNIQDIGKAVGYAKLLKFNLDENAKIGANEAYAITKRESTGVLKESIHVCCHVATTDPIKQDGNEIFDFEKGPIHYAGYQFELNPNNPYDDIIALHKIADRSDFPVNNKSSKGERFDDVIFPGGTGGPKETQYFTGVEDARIGVIDMRTIIR